MTNTEKQREKELTPSLIDSLIRYGHIKPNTSAIELQKNITDFIKRLDVDKVKIGIVVDHTVDILKLARDFASRLNYVASCIFYAMWIEHWVNGIIHTLCIRDNISSKHIVNMIREVSFRGKFSWLLTILGFPTINSKHQQRIFILAELRNSYVHYKWKVKKEEDHNSENSLLKETIESIESTIKYLQRLENSFIYKNKKNIVKKFQ